MQNKLYVGNLPFDTTEAELKELFGSKGNILSIDIIQDRATGRSKGFAFIEFESSEGADSAKKLNGTELNGRALKINQAKERRSFADRRDGADRRRG